MFCFVVLTTHPVTWTGRASLVQFAVLKFSGKPITWQDARSRLSLVCWRFFQTVSEIHCFIYEFIYINSICCSQFALK